MLHHLNPVPKDFYLRDVYFIPHISKYKSGIGMVHYIGFLLATTSQDEPDFISISFKL
jgi:hypothetical protein